MNDQRELDRHIRIMSQIDQARTIEDLPKITEGTITSFLANNVYFNNYKLSATLFRPIVDALLSNNFRDSEVRKVFFEIVKRNYPSIEDEDIFKKYDAIVRCKRIDYIMLEINERIKKTEEIIKSTNLVNHNEVVKQIVNANEIRELPKVGIGDLNAKLLRAFNNNSYINNFKTGDIKTLSRAYIHEVEFTEIEDIIEEILKDYDLTDFERNNMIREILSSLALDETIYYVVEEIKLKEHKKLQIYRMDHEFTMEAIHDARRISELPPSISVSTLNGYLNGNTTIYTNDDRINAEDLKGLTDLLLMGLKWDDEVVKQEVRDIASSKYPEKEDAYDRLYKKFTLLPRTYYLVEEINACLCKQREFIKNHSSNVNVYFMPNKKSPDEGGIFYNCYINRVDNLDLERIIPLDLDSIIPKGMDIDSVEWYVQEYYDETFKLAGAIILNRDETIGNVSIFRPNDGTVGISLEEKTKMDQIADLDRSIEEKKAELERLTAEVESRTKESSEIRTKLKKTMLEYKKKALELHKGLMDEIDSITTIDEELSDPKKLTLKNEE